LFFKEANEMARSPTPKEPRSASLSPDEMRLGIKRLEKRIAKLDQFDPQALDQADPSATTRPLETDIQTALTDTFGHDTVEYQRFSPAIYFHWPINFYNETPHWEKVDAVTRQKQRSLQLLSGAVEMLQERLDDLGELAAFDEQVQDPTYSNRVFVVHGHDNETKEAVARVLTKLGLDPIILHEQANRGRTIIQKFQDETVDVGFAVVLMSPDDELADGMKHARQNVVLELGFFLGRLGPARVAALKRGDVETPSDFDGVLYTTVDDAGMWRYQLAKELKAAGYNIDMNRIA
jgi:predicted nucleotide-binding protein